MWANQAKVAQFAEAFQDGKQLISKHALSRGKIQQNHEKRNPKSPV